MIWSRKPQPAPVHDRSRLVGLDINATRARAVSVGNGKTRTLLLDNTAEELRLLIHLDRRPLEIGRTAAAVVRRLPHVVCGGYLSLLGQSKTWAAGRQMLTPEGAVGLTFERLRGPVIGESDNAAVALPAYLTPQQVARLVELAVKAKLPLCGTATAALAVAAHRAATILHGADDEVAIGHERSSQEAEWVVPIRPQESGPGSVVLVDADDAALSAAAVAIEPGEARLVGSAAWPKLARPLWLARLLDGISDRCIRVCRRDPRDSADADQLLYDQLPDALDLAARGHPISLTVRSAHWYQDLAFRPTDLEGFTAPLSKSAGEGFRELLWSLPLPSPPRAIWLTAAAARLPGLANALFRGSPESTVVEPLPEPAVAEAAAALAARWKAGTLPRTHMDSVIPLEQERGVKSEERAVDATHTRKMPRASP